MQCLRFTLCGLLASCLCSWASSGSFSVSQSPCTVTLKKGGGSVQLTCSWNTNIKNVKVEWLKDNQKVQYNTSGKFIKTLKENKNCSTLDINNPDINDTGFYICEVTQDVPQLVKVKGPGTKVTYDRENGDGNGTHTCPTIPTTTSNSTYNMQSSAPVTLGASVSAALVILSICVCLCVWRVKRGCKQSERMVIREGPPSEGDEPEVSEDGESSRTSRGSTQWYMVPVYESYFDLQRSDDQQAADSDNAASAKDLKDKQQEVQSKSPAGLEMTT